MILKNKNIIIGYTFKTTIQPIQTLKISIEKLKKRTKRINILKVTRQNLTFNSGSIATFIDAKSRAFLASIKGTKRKFSRERR